MLGLVQILVGVVLALGLLACDSGGFSGGPGASAKVKEDQPKKKKKKKDENNHSNQIEFQGVEDEYESALEFEDSGSIVDACESGEIKRLEQEINFPATQGCGYGQGDNNPADGGTITARAVQNDLVKLPKGAVMCDVSLKSTTPSIEYDDFIYLTMGDFVLAGDSGGYAQALDRVEGIPVWDWLKVRGMKHDSKTPPFCVTGQCTMPGTEESGAIEIDVDTEIASKIAFALMGKGDLEFKLISMGDNEKDDCQHTPFSMNVSVSYIGGKD
jgi:hypothetical protein